MRFFNFAMIALGILWWTGIPVWSQIFPPFNRFQPTCNQVGCGSASPRCGPDGTQMSSCNSTSGQCYCLNYQCDNREKNCNTTLCRQNEQAECIFTKFGTSCKCLPITTPTYCDSVNTACNLEDINPSDIQHYGDICRTLGENYYAETCHEDVTCRCGNTSTNCTITGCGSSLLCGVDQPVPSCNATSGECYCLNYQCDNFHNCNSTLCPRGETPECVLDKYGTSCKCMPRGPYSPFECHGLFTRKRYADCSLQFVNYATIQRYDQICGQLGRDYFANQCRDIPVCVCEDYPEACRIDADCPCPTGSVGQCDVKHNECLAGCRCSSDTQCTANCPVGQKSTCSGECTDCRKNVK